MLTQLIDVKSNKIFVLQTVGKGTSCPACVWQTDLHTGTAAVSEPALSLLHMTAAIFSMCETDLSGLKLSVSITNPCSKLLCTEVKGTVSNI